MERPGETCQQRGSCEQEEADSKAQRGQSWTESGAATGGESPIKEDIRADREDMITKNAVGLRILRRRKRGGSVQAASRQDNADCENHQTAPNATIPDKEWTDPDVTQGATYIWPNPSHATATAPSVEMGEMSSSFNSLHTESISKQAPGLKILRRQTGDAARSITQAKDASPAVKYLRPLPGKITLTREPDSITFDEDSLSHRAKMPCGHVFAPETMATFIKHTLSESGVIFKCPATDLENDEVRPCENVWDYTLVRHVACFTEEEREEVEKKLGELYLVGASKAQQCPRCKHYCVRENTKQNRVCCTFCSRDNFLIKYCFCWACLHEWKSYNDKNCGNEECSGEDPRLRYLRNAEMKCMGYTGVKTYAVRACPNCGFLIHHTTGCKQMQCYSCRVRFCFVCLKISRDGLWPCGQYNSICKVAPIQTVLPATTE